ncbi:nitroreductase family deazaflavin-dependent oxidoreductase [bacterium]|nr:nitroreductase family deazaflavin-dependent oxidoreductase [bacterium]
MIARPLAAVAFLLAVAPATAAVLPGQLASYRDASTIELTTIGRRSGQPRTVIIWFVADDEGRLYVQSGRDGRTDWYLNLRQTPAVTMRIGELAMSGVAVPVADVAEVARVHELFRQKYLRARLSAWIGSDVGRGRVVQLGDLNQLP